MQYNKNEDGTFTPLEQKNVDTGLGVERVAMALQGKSNIFEIESFLPLMKKIDEITPTKRSKDSEKLFRVIADHMRASVFMLGDKRHIVPSNIDQGYILRRFIRRSIRSLKTLGVDLLKIDATVEIAQVIIDTYKEKYPLLEEKKDFIFGELKKEEDKFEKTLDKGIKEFEKMVKQDNKINSKEAFLLFQSYGFPIEITEELAEEKNIKVDTKGFEKEFEKHQEISRKGAEQKFKGGLSESSEETKKLHTATHLLSEALREVLKTKIKQKGSNITRERLRFDFNFDRKLTPEEKKEVEDLVNKKIQDAIPIEKLEMSFKEAKDMGAQAEFEAKYDENVFVYKMGDFSLEVCGGPHVNNTKELGIFKIKKEESSSAGVRRIKAILN